MIAVCGGKGGTGKSTYAVLLALRTGHLLVDTDAENPSLHHLLDVPLGKRIKEVYSEKASIIEEKCRKCGLCVKACRFNALFMPPGKLPVVIEDNCEGCGVCRIVCPFNAIEMKKVKIGEIYFNRRENLLTAVVNPGEEARKAAEEALKIARKMDREAIIDCPAGIHCNVIAQMIEADEVHAVTEPTPLGLSGLKELLLTLKELGKEAKVVINKYEPSEMSRKIEEISRRFGAEVIEKIPYSEKIARAYAEGKIKEVLSEL